MAPDAVGTGAATAAGVGVGVGVGLPPAPCNLRRARARLPVKWPPHHPCGSGHGTPAAYTDRWPAAGNVGAVAAFAAAVLAGALGAAAVDTGPPGTDWGGARRASSSSAASPGRAAT